MIELMPANATDAGVIAVCNMTDGLFEVACSASDPNCAWTRRRARRHAVRAAVLWVRPSAEGDVRVRVVEDYLVFSRRDAVRLQQNVVRRGDLGGLAHALVAAPVRRDEAARVRA